ncbi:hypothetical protein RP20_CCG009989 [Aedes albopictus]|nr:hypothetical protein RP20_CCG009989 [Aedes albopictus]
MYFDQGFADYLYPQVFAKQTPVPDNEKKMKDSKFVAGDELTIADLSILATVPVAKDDLIKYTNVGSWYARLRKKAPGTDVKKFAKYFEK